MKISELQELIDIAKERHGDIEVAIYEKMPFFGLTPRIINKLSVIRRSEGEAVEISEPLSELGSPLLMLSYIEEDDETEAKQDD